MTNARGLYACDARVKLGLGAVALVLVLGTRAPLTAWLVAALAAASLVAAGTRGLGRALAGLAMSAAIPIALVAWQQGGARAALVGGRVAGASAVGLWTLAATDFVALQAGLLWLGAPRLVVELLGLGRRYVFVFREVVQEARDAQALRLGYADARRGLRSVGALAGLVLARAVDQTATLTAAMALRGGDGVPRGAPPGPLERRDAWLVLAASLGLVAAALAPRLAAVAWAPRLGGRA